MKKIYVYLYWYYDSRQADLITSLVCGPLPPLTAFPRGFLADPCPRLAFYGRLRGSARSAPLRLRDSLTSRSTTRSTKSRALREFWRVVCRQGLRLRVFFFPFRPL